MSQGKNDVNRFAGEYLVQDQDHLSGVKQTGSSSRNPRQADQSQSSPRQQGGSDQHATGQQGSPRARRSK